MKKLILVLCLCLAAAPGLHATAPSGLNTKFDIYKKGFIERLWKLYPDWATVMGYHAYDNELVIPDSLEWKKELAFIAKELKTLKNFPIQDLSDANKIDFHLIGTQLKEQQWELTEQRSYQWNPANYNVGQSFAYILSENYAPLEKRIDNFYIKLQKVPAYYEAAKANIKDPAPEFVQLAIEQNEGSLSIFEKDLADSLNNVGLYPEHKEAILKKGREAADAIRSYISFLKAFKNDHPRSFRLGSELYQQKFAFELQSSFTPDQLYAAAQQRK